MAHVTVSARFEATGQTPPAQPAGSIRMTARDSRLAILVLHRLGDPQAWRAAVRDLEYLLPDHLPSHDYVVHDAEQPLPAFVKQTRFHAIVLGPTFLCARYAPWT